MIDNFKLGTMAGSGFDESWFEEPAPTAVRCAITGCGVEFVDLTVEERATFRDASHPAIDLTLRNLGDKLFALADAAKRGGAH